MSVTPFYTAMLALLFVVLSVRTLRLRRQLGITMGDAGDPQMLRAMRVHSNFAEYVPLSLILLFVLEAQSVHSWLIHGVGLCLLGGRLTHAYGVSQSHEKFKFRVAGMALTFTAILTSTLYLLFTSIRSFAA